MTHFTSDAGLADEQKKKTQHRKFVLNSALLLFVVIEEQQKTCPALQKNFPKSVP